MFYIFLEAVETRDEGYQYQTFINFSGPVKGKISMYFSQHLAETMVQNMLNIDRDEIKENLLEDCLKESLNMICGNFLRKVDASKVFDLSIPLFTATGQTQVHVSAVPEEHGLRLDFTGGDSRLALVLTAPAEM